MLPWGIEGVNRCRSYLRYQKTQKVKISKFGVTSLIQTWAVESKFRSNLHYTAHFSIKEVTPFFTFRVNEGNVKPVFFFKKGTFEAAPLRQKRKSDVYAVTGPGRGTGEGEASPSPPRRENFEILLPSNGFSLHLRLNSITFCLYTIHYNDALFSTQ